MIKNSAWAIEIKNDSLDGSGTSNGRRVTAKKYMRQLIKRCLDDVSLYEDLYVNERSKSGMLNLNRYHNVIDGSM